MTRFSKTLTLAALAAAVLAFPAAAQDRPSFGMADHLARHGGGLLRCFRGLDLTESQKTDIKAIFDAARPTFETDAAAIRAARQKLDADYTANSDKSVLGQDYLDVRAAASKLKSDGQAVRDQALAKLTPDQKTRAQECLAAQKGAGARFGHFAG